MSRDWTPIEHYMVEQRQIKQGYGDIFDFLENLKFVHLDGSKTVHSPEEMAIRKQFPMLGKLLMDDFMTLHEKMSDFSGGIEFLHEKDAELANLISALRTDKEGLRYVVKINGENIDVDFYLAKWFTGRLDENFYYAERNNQLLIENMCNEALQKGLSNWILTDPDCLQVRRQIGFENPGVFELIQIDTWDLDDKTVFKLAVGEIDLSDYSKDEISSALDGYGYENMQALQIAAGSKSEASGQLAEILFELNSTEFYVMKFETWNEALSEVESRTGRKLDCFKENAVPPLDDIIEEANSRLINGSAGRVLDKEIER